MGSVKKAVKKIARPKVLLPLAAAAILGPTALTGLKGAALKGAAAKGSLMGSGAVTSALAPNVGIGAALKAAPALAGNFIKTGLMNPFSKQGAAVYGGAGLGLAALMGKDKTPEQEKLGVDPQAQYNLMRLMNEKMGGAYTDEELNILAAPQLSMYGGEYQTTVGPERKRRPMFEGLNYSGLTRLAADGGSIKPKKKSKALKEEQERLDAVREAVIEDMLFSQGVNEDVMFDMMRRQELNPVGRKDGGLMQLAMSDPDPMAERSDMMENIALDKFGKPLSRLTDKEIIEIEEMIENMMPMADGGSIPQTNNVPNGMQIDGRGGGFIPMGAKERKDDVPAMLAKNEFVMTADAVRAAGGGDVNVGAQKMYDLMNSLESKV